MRFWRWGLTEVSVGWGLVVKRVSGWCVWLFLDAVCAFLVREVGEAVGLGSVLRCLVVLVNGRLEKGGGSGTE